MMVGLALPSTSVLAALYLLQAFSAEAWSASAPSWTRTPPARELAGEVVGGLPAAAGGGAAGGGATAGARAGGVSGIGAPADGGGGLPALGAGARGPPR